MDSYLELLRQELEEAMAVPNAGVANAGGTEQTASESWTADQILEHLFLTYKHTGRGLRRCLEQGAPLATPATLKDRFATALVIKLGYLPNGRKSPERATPRGMPPEEVREGIFVELQKMASELDDCERQFGWNMKIMNHPFLGPLTAQEWRKFHWVHGRHHARQIRERVQFSRPRG